MILGNIGPVLDPLKIFQSPGASPFNLSKFEVRASCGHTQGIDVCNFCSRSPNHLQRTLPPEQLVMLLDAWDTVTCTNSLFVFVAFALEVLELRAIPKIAGLTCWNEVCT